MQLTTEKTWFKAVRFLTVALLLAVAGAMVYSACSGQNIDYHGPAGKDPVYFGVRPQWH